MFKTWARETLAPLINRQVTPGLTFRDYKRRVHHLYSEEPYRLDSANPEVGDDGSPPAWKPRKRARYDVSLPKIGESGPSASRYISQGDNSRRALSEPSVIAVDDDETLDYPEDPDWGIDKLIDFKIEGSEKRWLVKWQSAYIDQKYIHGKNEDERHLVIAATKKTWTIKREVDRSHARAGVVHVLWHDTWLHSSELRGHHHLMDKLQRAGPVESYQMTKPERKRYLAMYYEKAGWVDVTPGHDIFEPVRDILQDSNTTKKPKTEELLQEPQLRAVLLHGHRFDKNAALRRFHLTTPTLHAILLQGTGKLADTPCRRCREYDSVFIGGCVVSSTENAWFNGACACCQIAGKSTKCEHHRNNTGSDTTPPRRRTRPKKHIRYAETLSEGSDDENRSGYGPKTPTPKSSPSPPIPSPLVSIKSSPKAETVKTSKSPEPMQLSDIPMWQPEPPAAEEDVTMQLDTTMAAVIDMALQDETQALLQPVIDDTVPFSSDMSRTLFVTPGPVEMLPPLSGPAVSEIAIGRGSARPPDNVSLQPSRGTMTAASPSTGRMLPPRAPRRHELPRAVAANHPRHYAPRGQQNVSLPLPQPHMVRKFSPNSVQLQVPQRQRGRRPSPREALAAAQSSHANVNDRVPAPKHNDKRAHSVHIMTDTGNIGFSAPAMSMLGRMVRCTDCSGHFVARPHHFESASGSFLCTPCGKAAIREQERRASLGLGNPPRPRQLNQRDHNHKAGKLRRVSEHNREHVSRKTSDYDIRSRRPPHAQGQLGETPKRTGVERSSSNTPRPRMSSYTARVYEKSQCAGSLDGLPVFVLTSP